MSNIGDLDRDEPSMELRLIQVLLNFFDFTFATEYAKLYDKLILRFLLCSLMTWPDQLGVMKRGRGTCSTFEAFNLTYLHVLHS